MDKAHTLAHMEGQQLWTDLSKANEEIRRLTTENNKLRDEEIAQFGQGYDGEGVWKVSDLVLTVRLKVGDEVHPSGTTARINALTDRIKVLEDVLAMGRDIINCEPLRRQGHEFPALKTAIAAADKEDV